MNPKEIDRREALKILVALGAAVFTPGMFSAASALQRKFSGAHSPNVIVMVFDSLSARHMSLYGYQRHTTPFIEKFAAASTVYHHHYSAANFTQSSTPSMLTGVYPWSHRSLDFFETLPHAYEENNIFSEVASSYSTLAYTHNIHVMNILEQFRSSIDLLKAIEDLVLFQANKVDSIFRNDHLMGEFASKRWLEDFLSPSYSFFLNPLFTVESDSSIATIDARYKDQYPLGLSENDGYLFRMEDTIDWIIRETRTTQTPFLGYFHLLPPHESYKPRADFYGLFANDHFRLPAKPPHFFSEGFTEEQQQSNCQLYDEYVAHVDSEFGRLVEKLNEQGTLDNSYLILTSDHGQLFERGIHGHVQPTLYDSVIHTPLVIHAPGQTQRVDVQTPTSSLDLLPTIRSITGTNGDIRTEGQVLPALGGKDTGRTIFSMYARENPKEMPLTRATFAAIQWPFKLIEYRGYAGLNNFVELYDLEKDPEELTNLAETDPSMVSALRAVLHRDQTIAENMSLRAKQPSLTVSAFSTDK